VLITLTHLKQYYRPDPKRGLLVRLKSVTALYEFCEQKYLQQSENLTIKDTLITNFDTVKFTNTYLCRKLVAM
jgi:hypothetical protein